jgi:crossover junction endodeoxyribonuclease RuvC
MRVLGIDPGLSVTGYGCVDASGSLEPSLVEAGVLRLPVRAPMPVRLGRLYESLIEIVGSLRPDIMVVEQLFSHYGHVRTAILMGHARGVVLLAAHARGVAVDELGATEVKKAVTGNGHASKDQMQRAVMSQCRLAEPPQPSDVADAIGIALCAARRLETGGQSPVPAAGAACAH